MGTIKIKTSEASDVALDWLVANIQRLNYRIKEKDDLSKQIVILESTPCPDNKPGCCVAHFKANYFSPSTNWSQGGPIIEREGTYLRANDDNSKWACGALSNNRYDKKPGPLYWAETPLIAAMRCYVASKLGDEVEIPEELA